MATISHLAFSLSFPSFLHQNPLFYYHHQQPRLFASYLNSSTKKNGFVCFACSIKQTRVRKRVKSNEELRSEIMEFVALTGLPEGHVPSMKELSANGRVDLANIVRRRGYKFIKELVANSDLEDCNELDNTKNMETSASDICLEDSLTEGQGKEALDVVDGKLYTEQPSNIEMYFTATDDQTENDFPKEVGMANSSPEVVIHESLSEDESSLAGFSSHSGEIIEKSLKIESVEIENRADTENSSSEASVSVNHSLVLDDTSSCSEREADIVLEVNDVDEASISANNSLDLDDISSCSDTEAENVLMTEDEEINNVEENFSYTDDHHYTSPDLNYTNHVYIAASEPLSALNSENTSSTSSIEEKTARFMQNGYLDTVDDDENDIPEESGEYVGDSYGGPISASTPLNGSALALEEVTYDTEVNSSNRNNDQKDGSADMDKDPHDDETMKRENQVEITRLRFMLRQKELELSKLKEQIEKEKLSLSVLQRQAETEINKAQMLISEKAAELQEAEESLSGLQEVEIEYCGDGNVVEVTGSFNGWQHRVGMELQASKSIGKQKRWSTLLWLYPGTYEIKFIVDGSWTTNPQIDSVTRGHITNNILKVDR